MKQLFFCITFGLVLFVMPTALYAQSGTGTGSFTFTLNNYTVQGQLGNAIIHYDNSVTLTMTVNSDIQTSIARVPISGSGEWYGRANVTSLAGTIQNVNGNARICMLYFFCGDANYIGQGTWVGTLSGSQGTGTFQGTITFTSSPIPQIPVNQPIPISGTWSSNFQLSS